MILLDDLNIKYYREYNEKEADSECIIGPYNFDCVILRENQPDLVIECQGDYWHTQEKSIRMDQSKSTYIRKFLVKRN